MFRIFSVRCYRTGLYCTYYYRRVKKIEVSCYYLILLHKNQSEMNSFLFFPSLFPTHFLLPSFPPLLDHFIFILSSRSCILYFDQPRNLLKFKTPPPPPQYSGFSLIEEHFRRVKTKSCFFLPLTINRCSRLTE